MGVQETILYSVRFSIISDYFSKEQIGSVTSYIEFCWFTASCLGQIIGSGLIAYHSNIIVNILFFGGIFCVTSSYFLYPTVQKTTQNIKFYWNPFKDLWLMLKNLFQKSKIALNITITAWFWCFIIISSTQFSVFVANYVDNNSHLFTLFLGADAIGIALGSIVCAKLSKGQVKIHYIRDSGIIMSLVTFIILALYYSKTDLSISLSSFFYSSTGISMLILIFVKSIAAGFYSQTCYTEAQLIASDSNRSQVIMAISIVSAFFTLLISIFCSTLELVITSKGVLFGLALVNLIIIYLFVLKRKKIYG